MSRAVVSPEEVFFEQTYNLFRQAVARTDAATDFHFSLAGHVIRLRFAGPELVPLLTPAFAHLRCAARAEPDLTICVWTNQFSGTATPQPPATGQTVCTEFVDGPAVKLGWEPATGALTA